MRRLLWLRVVLLVLVFLLKLVEVAAGRVLGAEEPLRSHRIVATSKVGRLLGAHVGVVTKNL